MSEKRSVSERIGGFVRETVKSTGRRAARGLVPLGEAHEKVARSFWHLEQTFSPAGISTGEDKLRDSITLLRDTEGRYTGEKKIEAQRVLRAYEAKADLLNFYSDSWLNAGRLESEGGPSHAGFDKLPNYHALDTTRAIQRLIENDPNVVYWLKMLGEIRQNTGEGLFASFPDVLHYMDQERTKLARDTENKQPTTEEMEQLSGALYAYMIWDITCMHAELDAPKVTSIKHGKELKAYADASEQYWMKATVGKEHYLAYEPVITSAGLHWALSPVKTHDGSGREIDIEHRIGGVSVPPYIEEKVKKNDGTYEKEADGNDKIVKRPLRNIDVITYTNFWVPSVDWTKQPEEIRDAIKKAQRERGRRETGFPLDGEDLLLIDWGKLNLNPDALVKSAFSSYADKMRKAQGALKELFSELGVFPTLELGEHGSEEALKKIVEIEGDNKIMKTYVREPMRKILLASLRQMIGDLFLRGATVADRNKEFAQTLTSILNLRAFEGDQKQLYLRSMTGEALTHEPLTPAQVAYFLMDLYYPDESVRVKGGIAGKRVRFRDILDAGGETLGFPEGKGRSKETLSQWLGRMETEAEVLGEEHPFHRAQWDMHISDVGEMLKRAYENGDEKLVWLLSTFSGVQANPMIDPNTRRFLGVEVTNKEWAGDYRIWQYLALEAPCRTYAGLPSGSGKIYERNEFFERTYREVITSLRRRHRETDGDKILTFCAGGIMGNPTRTVGTEEDENPYMPYTERTSSAIKPMWLFPSLRRTIHEFAMIQTKKFQRAMYPKGHSERLGGKRMVVLDLAQRTADVLDYQAFFHMIEEQAKLGKFYETAEQVREYAELFDVTPMRTVVYENLLNILRVPDLRIDTQSEEARGSGIIALFNNIPILDKVMGMFGSHAAKVVPATLDIVELAAVNAIALPLVSQAFGLINAFAPEGFQLWTGIAVAAPNTIPVIGGWQALSTAPEFLASLLIYRFAMLPTARFISKQISMMNFPKRFAWLRYFGCRDTAKDMKAEVEAAETFS